MSSIDQISESLSKNRYCAFIKGDVSDREYSFLSADYPLRLFFGCIFDGDQVFDKHKKYENLEEILADGWEVD